MLSLALCALGACAHPLLAQSPVWRLEATPTLVLGKESGDESEAFAQIVGATRLPNGNIMVADRGEYSLHIFSPVGKVIKQFGRKGSGPGEFDYLARFFRCGSSVLTYDIGNGQSMSVFSVDGVRVRSFRFSTKIGNEIPYESACNSAGTFLHFGWMMQSARKLGVYRASVPAWLSGADSLAGRSLGTIEGSERWGQKGGDGPLPLGREPQIAIGSSRAYIGEATTYRIRVFALDGRVLPDITKAAKTIPVRQVDIQAELERQIASDGEKYRKQLTAYFGEITLPKVLPPYRALLVDANDHLWVQDYAQFAAGLVTWTVFDAAGKQVTEVSMPQPFDVFEIGADYVLGRFIDADTAVPQVRMYRLNKRAR